MGEPPGSLVCPIARSDSILNDHLFGGELAGEFLGGGRSLGGSTWKILLDSPCTPSASASASVWADGG